MQEQVIQQLMSVLQERVGLNADQAQQAVQVAMDFAQQNSGQIIQAFGPHIMQNFGPQIMEQLGPQITQMLGGNAGGLLGGLFGGNR